MNCPLCGRTMIDDTEIGVGECYNCQAETEKYRQEFLKQMDDEDEEEEL